MATPLYAELRGKCHAKGITQEDIAKRLNRSRGNITMKFSGAAPWELNEMYAMMDMLHEPPRKLHLYFPRDGKWCGSVEDPPPGAEDAMIDAIKSLIRKEVGG